MGSESGDGASAPMVAGREPEAPPSLRSSSSRLSPPHTEEAKEAGAQDVSLHLGAGLTSSGADLAAGVRERGEDLFVALTLGCYRTDVAGCLALITFGAGELARRGIRAKHLADLFAVVASIAEAEALPVRNTDLDA